MTCRKHRPGPDVPPRPEGGVRGSGWGATVRSAGNGGRQGGVSMGLPPPPPPLSPSPNRTAVPYHPAWGETNTGSSFGMGEFPWISPGWVDKQTDTLIEFEREGKRERKRRGRGAIVAKRRSVSRLTGRGCAHVSLLCNRLGSKFFICRSETGRHGLSQWGIYLIARQTSQLVTGTDSNYTQLVMLSITRHNEQGFPQAVLHITLQHSYIVIVCTILIELTYKLATGGKWLICSGANKRSSSVTQIKITCCDPHPVKLVCLILSLRDDRKVYFHPQHSVIISNSSTICVCCSPASCLVTGLAAQPC